MAPLSWVNAFTTWRLDLPSTIVFLVLGFGYLVLLRRVKGWPVRDVLLFEFGVVLGLIAVNSSIEAYSRTLYWMHMIQHLMMIMVVPAFLILGRPLTLLARVGGQRVAGVLRGRTVAALTAPPVTLVFYAVVVVGTHLTAFLPAVRDNPGLRYLELVLYLLSGYLFFITMFNCEPIRWRLSYPLRLFLSFIGMVVDTVVGVILMMHNTDAFAISGMVPNDWGPAPLSDLRTGGAVMWVLGDGLMVLIAVYIIGAWISAPRDAGMGRWLEAARRQQFAEATGTQPETAPEHGEDSTIDDEEEANLAAYNAMLRRLAAGEHRRER